jgi:hypothetical protein
VQSENTGVVFTPVFFTPAMTQGRAFMYGTQSCVVRRTLYMSEKSLKNGQNRLKCAVLHTDPAVVGRKSGPPKSQMTIFAQSAVLTAWFPLPAEVRSFPLLMRSDTP